MSSPPTPTSGPTPKELARLVEAITSTGDKTLDLKATELKKIKKIAKYDLKAFV